MATKKKRVRIRKGKNTASISFSCEKALAEHCWTRALNTSQTMSHYIRRLIEYDLKHKVVR
jgi:hypothetical protein